MLLFPIERFVCSKADLIKALPALSRPYPERLSALAAACAAEKKESMTQGAALRLPGNPCSSSGVQLGPFPKALTTVGVFGFAWSW